MSEEVYSVHVFFLAILEFELRASHLLSRSSTTRATAPALFEVGSPELFHWTGFDP
jgi:hypothetical protein